MSERRRVQTEQDRHRRAFEIYYSQGGGRSHDRVAKELKVSLPTVKAWSRSFSWQRRVDERDAQVAREVADRSIQSSVEENERNLKIVRVALMKLAKGIADGKVKMQMGDLDRLIRLETFLREGTGDPANAKSAEEMLVRFRDAWERFSPEEQHTAMNKICPGWQSDLSEDAKLKKGGPVLVLPDDSKFWKPPVLILPDDGSGPRITDSQNGADADV